MTLEGRRQLALFLVCYTNNRAVYTILYTPYSLSLCNIIMFIGHQSNVTFLSLRHESICETLRRHTALHSLFLSSGLPGHCRALMRLTGRESGGQRSKGSTHTPVHLSQFCGGRRFELVVCLNVTGLLVYVCLHGLIDTF